MNKIITHKKQSGFFDLGLSLILLTVFGTTTAVVVSNHTDEQPTQLASCPQGIDSQDNEGNRCQ